jgi:hypothetical protein
MNVPTTFENYSGSLYDHDKDKRVSQSIFVSIVSYRDPNIINTLHSLLANCKSQENLTVSIVACVFKNPERWVNELKSVVNSISNGSTAKIILEIVEASKIHNLGELKNISHEAYNKEDFYLSVSSSSEFDPYWDDILIKQFNTLSLMRGNDNFVLTCNPRGFITHDNIVPGYVFFTNHKTNMSFQREEYDGSRPIVSGYNNFADEKNPLPGKGLYNSDDINKNFKKTVLAENFLNKYGFVIFNDRKFLKNEYICTSNGISDRFIFCDAKNYFKINKIENFVIDREDFNFISYMNFIKNRFDILTVRWTPVYHMYDDDSLLSIKRPSPSDNYQEKNISESDSYVSIIKSIKDLLESEDKHLAFSVNSSLSVDWENRVFKKSNSFSSDNVISGINSFISFYNFSTNENSLHWNNRLLK